MTNDSMTSEKATFDLSNDLFTRIQDMNRAWLDLVSDTMRSASASLGKSSERDTKQTP